MCKQIALRTWAAFAVLAAWLTATSGCVMPKSAPKPLLPGISLDQNARVIVLEGEVCLEQGLLEYIAVADGGKKYESVFSLRCRPSQLQAAMLMAGYDPGHLPDELRGDFAPQAAARTLPEGAPRTTPPPPEYGQQLGASLTRVYIDVDVRRSDGTWAHRPVESFLIERRTGKPPKRLSWAFTGSFFLWDETLSVEYFVADREKSLVALWYDPTALLNLTRSVGDPYRGEDLGLEVNPASLPAKGTAVRLNLIPAAETP